jgi:hypothetical protein
MKFNLTYKTRKWINVALLILGFPMAFIVGILFAPIGDTGVEPFMVLLGMLLFYVPYVLGIKFVLFTKEELAKATQEYQAAIRGLNKTALEKKTTKTVTKTTVNGVETITETLTEEY